MGEIEVDVLGLFFVVSNNIAGMNDDDTYGAQSKFD